MGSKIITAIFVTLTVYIFLWNRQNLVAGAPSSPSNLEAAHRPRNRPMVRFISRAVSQYPRIKPESFTDFIDDDDLFDLSKRQTSDDYGHLRFGKRGEELFDDYGHMRFGRSGNAE